MVSTIKIWIKFILIVLPSFTILARERVIIFILKKLFKIQN